MDRRAFPARWIGAVGPRKEGSAQTWKERLAQAPDWSLDQKSGPEFHCAGSESIWSWATTVMSAGCAAGSMILPTSRDFPNISKRSKHEHDKNNILTFISLIEKGRDGSNAGCNKVKNILEAAHSKAKIRIKSFDNDDQFRIKSSFLGRAFCWSAYNRTKHPREGGQKKTEQTRTPGMWQLAHSGSRGDRASVRSAGDGASGA
jgi:hypothetical protein